MSPSWAPLALLVICALLAVLVPLKLTNPLKALTMVALAAERAKGKGPGRGP
jgi:hypothetical protein